MKLLARIRSTKGFTVVELVIALSVIGLVVMLVTNFAVGNLVQYTITNSRANLLGQAQLALDVMTDDIRLSAGVDENNRWEDEYGPGGESDLFSWESGSETIILATIAENSDREILFDDTSEYIPHKNNVIYFLEGDTLYKRVLAAPVDDNKITSTCPEAEAIASCPADRILTSNITDFSISYANSAGDAVSPTEARSAEVFIELSERKFGEDVIVSYTTRMVFRND